MLTASPRRSPSRSTTSPTEIHLPAPWIGKVAGAKTLLDIDGAADCLHRTRKLGQNGITRGVEDAAGRFGDEIVDYRSIGGEPPQRFLLVVGDECTVPRDVGGHDCCDFALHQMPLSDEKRVFNLAVRNTG